LKFENINFTGKLVMNKKRKTEISQKLSFNGTSPTNLRKFREFYLGYLEIQQTVSVKSFDSKKDNCIT